MGIKFNRLMSIYIFTILNTVDFLAYLVSKKIDPVTFKNADPNRFEEWQVLFNQIHPDSFTFQKMFLINDIRRRYHLKGV